MEARNEEKAEPEPQEPNSSDTHMATSYKVQPLTTPNRILKSIPEVQLMVTEISDIAKSIVRRNDCSLCICYYGRSDKFTKVKMNDVAIDISCDVILSDIAVHPATGKMFCIHESRRDVRSLNHLTGETEKVFDLDDYPYCLCITQHSDVIVGIDNKQVIQIYNIPTGAKQMTVECPGYPRHISTCRSTGRTAVACGYRGMIVLDTDYELVYQNVKYCWDVEFDKHGYLIVSDADDNNCVYIYNATTGQQKLTIMSDKMKGKVKCLAFRHDGKLVLVTKEPLQLLSIKYVQ